MKLISSTGGYSGAKMQLDFMAFPTRRSGSTCCPQLVRLWPADCGVQSCRRRKPAGSTMPPTLPPLWRFGAITSGPLSIPFSHYASDEALAQFLRDATRPPAPGLGGPIDASRRYYDAINSDRVSE